MGDLKSLDKGPVRVRFSQEIDNRDSVSATAPSRIQALSESTRYPAAQNLSASARPVSILVKRAAKSTAPPRPSVVSRTRERGYSLRRLLLNRNINDRLSEDKHAFIKNRGEPNCLPKAVDSIRQPNASFHPLISLDSDHKSISNGSTKSEGSENSTAYMKRSVKRRQTFIEASMSHYDSFVRLLLNDSSPFRKINIWRENLVKKLFGSVELHTLNRGRHIKIDTSRTIPIVDGRSGKVFIGNDIRSSRYTIWSFVPRQLFFQFSKLANAYFLLVSVLQMIPGLSTTGTYTTIAPLLVFVAISMGKEGFDDLRRSRLDRVENSRKTLVLRLARPPKNSTIKRLHPYRDWLTLGHRSVNISDENNPDFFASSESTSTWTTLEWQEVRVGDIVKLRRNDPVPADIVLLHVEGVNSIAYIETMALDGETNLKSKQAPALLAKKYDMLNDITSCCAQVVVEDPNIDLYNFDGHMSVGEETTPLTINEVVLRGSTLRNTTAVIGLVINTGEECKIRMNANKNSRIKAPEIQKITNRIVVLLVLFVLSLTVLCTIAYHIWSSNTEEFAFYLNKTHINISQIFIGFFILYNTLIPLSLYVSLEVIKVGLSSNSWPCIKIGLI